MSDQNDIYLNEYDKHMTGNRNAKPSTIKSYSGRVRQLVRFTGKLIPDITEKDVRNFMLSLVKDGRCRNYRRLTVTALRGFYTWYAKTYKKKNPTLQLKDIRKEHKIPHIPLLDDVVRLILSFNLDTEIGLRNAAIVSLIADTGLRVAEVCALKVGSIIKDKHQMMVNVPAIKSTVERQVPFAYLSEGDLVSEIWSAYYASIVLVNKRPANSPLFVRSNHWNYRHNEEDEDQGITTGTVRDILKKASANADLMLAIRPHSLRHFYATYLAIGGTAVTVIQNRLGHSSSETTDKYIHYGEIISGDSAKSSPLSGHKGTLKGFTKIVRGL